MGNEVSRPVRIQQNVFELPVKLPVVLGPLDDGGVYKGDLDDSINGYVKQDNFDYVDQDIPSKVIIRHHELDDNELNKEVITSYTEIELNMNGVCADNHTRDDNTDYNNRDDSVPIKMMNMDTDKDVGTANQNDDKKSCQKPDIINIDNSFKSRLSVVLNERIKRNSDSLKILNADVSPPENVKTVSPEQNVATRKENAGFESFVSEENDQTELSKNDCGSGTESSHGICQKKEHPVLLTVSQVESENTCQGAECEVLQETTSEQSVSTMEDIKNSNVETECYIEQDTNEIQSNNGRTQSENQGQQGDNLESKILQEVIQKEKEKKDITVKEKHKKKDSFKVKFKELTKRYKKSSKKQGNTASAKTVCHDVPTNYKAREIQNEYDYKPKNPKKDSDKEHPPCTSMKDVSTIQNVNLPTCSEETSVKTIEDFTELPNTIGGNSVDMAGEYVTLSHLDLATVVELDSESETTPDKVSEDRNENLKDTSATCSKNDEVVDSDNLYKEQLPTNSENHSRQTLVDTYGNQNSERMPQNENSENLEFSDSKTAQKCNGQIQNQYISEENIKMHENAESQNNEITSAKLQGMNVEDRKSVPSVLQFGTENIDCVGSRNMEQMDGNVTNSIPVKGVHEYETVHNDDSVYVSEPFKTSDAKVAAICRIDSQIYQKEVSPAVSCSSEKHLSSSKGNNCLSREIGGTHVKLKTKEKDKKSSFLKYLLYMEPKKSKKKTRKKEIQEDTEGIESSVSVAETTENAGNESAVHLEKSAMDDVSRTKIQNVESVSDQWRAAHSGELSSGIGIKDTEEVPEVPSSVSETVCELKEYGPKGADARFAECRNAEDISENGGSEISSDVHHMPTSSSKKLSMDDTCDVSKTDHKMEETTSNFVFTTENRSTHIASPVDLDNVQVHTNEQEDCHSEMEGLKHVKSDRNSNEVRLEGKQAIDTQVVKSDTAVLKDNDVSEKVIMRRKGGDRQLHSTNSNSEIQKPKRKNSLSARISGFFSQSDMFRTSSGFKRHNKKKDDTNLKSGNPNEKRPVNMKKRYSEPDLGVQGISGLGISVDNRVRMEPNGEVLTANEVKRRTKKNKTKGGTKKRHSAVIMQGIGMDDVEFQFNDVKRRSLFDEDFKLEEFSDDLAHDVISLSSLSSTEGDTGSTLHIAHVHLSPDQEIPDKKELDITSSSTTKVDIFSKEILTEKVEQFDCESEDRVKDSKENVNIERSNSLYASEIIHHVTSDIQSESGTTESADDMAGKFLKNTFSRKSKNNPVKCSENGKSDAIKGNGVCKEKTSCSIEEDETETYTEESQSGIIDKDCTASVSQQNNPSNERCNLSDKQSHLNDWLPEGDVVNDTKHIDDRDSSCKSKSVSVCNGAKQSDDENGLKPNESDILQNLNMEELSVQKVQMFDENPKKNTSIYRSFSETEARGVYCTNPIDTNPTVKLSKGKSRSSSFSDFWRRPSKQKVLTWKSKSKSKDGVQRQPLGNVVQSSSTSILYM